MAIVILFQKTLQQVLNLLRQLLKSILAGFWEIFKSGFWLLVQLIELAAWAASAFSKQIQRMQRLLKVALKRNKMALISWPFKQLLLGIWAVIVAAFLLLIEIIELFVWALSKLRSPLSPPTSYSQERLEKMPLPPSVELRRRAMSELGGSARKNNAPSVSPDSPNPPNDTAPPPAVESRRSGFNAARGKPRLVVTLIFLLPSLFLAIAAFTPAALDFEGNLLVADLSFTYAGSNANKLFLNSIRGIERFEIEGMQQLTLTGKFQSQADPGLNQLTKLTVQLPNRSSKLILQPAKPQQSQLELVELRLQPHTTVTRFGYNPNGKWLAVSLEPDRAKQPNSLKLSLGKQPLKIILKDYRLPKGNLKNSKIPNSLEFTLTPAVQQLNLAVQQSTALSLRLPEAKADISEQWVWGYLDVRDVKLDRTGLTNNPNRETLDSTIIAGEIQMAGQKLKIEGDSFLLPGQPGIQRIGNIQIHPEESPGLKVSIQGNSEKVAVGTDINSPVSSIQGKFLNRYLPRYAIDALFAFWAVVVGYLLLCFFNQLPKKS